MTWLDGSCGGVCDFQRREFFACLFHLDLCFLSPRGRYPSFPVPLHLPYLPAACNVAECSRPDSHDKSLVDVRCRSSFLLYFLPTVPSRCARFLRCHLPRWWSCSPHLLANLNAFPSVSPISHHPIPTRPVSFRPVPHAIRFDASQRERTRGAPRPLAVVQVAAAPAVTAATGRERTKAHPSAASTSTAIAGWPESHRQASGISVVVVVRPVL